MVSVTGRIATNDQISGQVPKQSGRLESLQALRGIAILGIFLHHAYFFFDWSRIGVSVFFVLSGFLMMYNYSDRPLPSSFKDNLRFSINRIKKLYSLHIITMVLCFILNTLFAVRKGIAFRRLVSLILNVFLLQSWFPDARVCWSLNGAAWYLSTGLFLYFLFPYLRGFVKRWRLRRLVLMCVAMFFLQIITSLPFLYVFGNDSPVYQWFTYCFPVFRTVDFFYGCVLARWFFGVRARVADERDARASFLLKDGNAEVVLLAVTVAVELWIQHKQTNLLLLSLQNMTTLHMPLAAAWVYLFAANRGIVTKMCVKKPFIKLGNISAHFFLIHFPVTLLVTNLLDALSVDLNDMVKVLVVAAELIGSILLTIGYQRLHQWWIGKQNSRSMQRA